MRIKCFKLTRVQDRHIRIMGDNQVLKVYDRHLGRELTTDSGDLGPEIRASLSYPRPLRDEIVRTFEEEAWLGLFGTDRQGSSTAVQRLAQAVCGTCR
jgi:hypothetical protein